MNSPSPSLLSPSSRKIRDAQKTTRHIEACLTQRVKVQRGVIYIHRDASSVWLIAALKPFYVERNLHVFYLDVQSAGSLGDDGQSVCELQAVLSVLSQLLGFVIRLFSSLVSARGKQHCLSLLPPSLDPAEHAGHFGGCSRFVPRLSIQKFRCLCLDLLCI